MSKTLNGELSVRINDQEQPVEVVFSRPNPVRKLRSYMKSEFQHHKFVKASWDKRVRQEGVMEMVDQYLDYVESEKKRNFKKVRTNGDTYREIQGWTFKIMIDHHLNTLGMKRFADTFMKLLSGTEKLAYVVFESKVGMDGRYLNIWVCDYEFTGKPTLITKVYDRTIYRYKDTKGFCKSTAPNAECYQKKGEPICDEKGNPIEVEVYFAPRKCATLDRMISSVYWQARRCVVDTYVALASDMNPQFKFRRFHIFWGNDAKLNKIYQAMNRTQQSMEQHIMFYLKDELLEDPHEIQYSGSEYLRQSFEERHFKLSHVGRELKKLFRHYEGAFKNHHFTDVDGLRKNLIHSSLPRDRLLENIQHLWHRFKQDMQNLIEKHNLKSDYMSAYSLSKLCQIDV